MNMWRCSSNLDVGQNTFDGTRRRLLHTVLDYLDGVDPCLRQRFLDVPRAEGSGWRVEVTEMVMRCILVEAKVEISPEHISDSRHRCLIHEDCARGRGQHQ